MSIWIPVLVAVVTGLFALAGQAILAKSNTKELLTKLDKQSEISDQKLQAKIDVIDTKIETLSERVNAHNNLIDRMYHVEAAVTELQHNQQRGA